MSDRALAASNPGPDLYCAYYSETADFLLRYCIAPTSPTDSVTWGDFSFSGDSDDIRGAIAQLKSITGLPLNLIGSATYFDAISGR